MVISFADGTQCGDGTIYRATGFQLVGIVENTALRINPKTGKAIHVIQAHHLKISADFRTWQPFSGKQLKYIYLIDKSCKITVPIIPFSKIDEMGAGMYRGEKVSLQERKAKHAAVAHTGEHLASSQKGAFDSTLPLNETAE